MRQTIGYATDASPLGSHTPFLIGSEIESSHPVSPIQNDLATSRNPKPAAHQREPSWGETGLTVIEGHEALVGDLELEGVEEGGGVVQHRHVGDVHRAHRRRRRQQSRPLEQRERKRKAAGFSRAGGS
jgi:hypothetical protein